MEPANGAPLSSPTSKKGVAAQRRGDLRIGGQSRSEETLEIRVGVGADLPLAHRGILGDERWEEAPAGESVTLTSPFVQRALALLSQKQREIISLLKLEGWSVAEIAAKTGLSPGAVKVTAHRGYQKIRKLIVRPAHDE